MLFQHPETKSNYQGNKRLAGLCKNNNFIKDDLMTNPVSPNKTSPRHELEKELYIHITEWTWATQISATFAKGQHKH